MFASASHHEALWEVTFDGSPLPLSGAFREGRQSITFLREETAFTLQNKQNKLYLKSRAHRAAKGMAHSGVSTAPIKEEILTTDKWKSHSWPDSDWTRSWKAGKFEWTRRNAQIHRQAFWAHDTTSLFNTSKSIFQCLPEDSVGLLIFYCFNDTQKNIWDGYTAKSSLILSYRAGQYGRKKEYFFQIAISHDI